MLDRIALQFDMEGIKGKDDERRLFEIGDSFKYFPRSGGGWGGGGGDYLREAINRGTAIIRGNTVTPSRPSILNNITTL